LYFPSCSAILTAKSLLFKKKYANLDKKYKENKMNIRRKIALPGKSAARDDFLLSGFRVEETRDVDSDGKILVALGSPFTSVVGNEINKNTEAKGIMLTGGRSPGFKRLVEGMGIRWLELRNRKALHGESYYYDFKLEREMPEARRIFGMMSVLARNKVIFTDDESQTTYENLLYVRQSTRTRGKRVVLLVHELHALRAYLTAKTLLRDAESIETKTFRLPANNDFYQSVMANQEFYNIVKYSKKWDDLKSAWMTGDSSSPVVSHAFNDIKKYPICGCGEAQEKALGRWFDKDYVPNLGTFSYKFLNAVDILAPHMSFSEQKYYLKPGHSKHYTEGISLADARNPIRGIMATLSGGFEMDDATWARMQMLLESSR
jgi:uncharacterized SAM-binding protein YcdF (DUF218 family)